MDLQQLFYLVAILALLAWLFIGILVLLVIWQVKRKVDEGVRFVQVKKEEIQEMFHTSVATVIGEKILNFVRSRRKSS